LKKGSSLKNIFPFSPLFTLTTYYRELWKKRKKKHISLTKYAPMITMKKYEKNTCMRRIECREKLT